MKMKGCEKVHVDKLKVDIRENLEGYRGERECLALKSCLHRKAATISKLVPEIRLDAENEITQKMQNSKGLQNDI